jgi:hypothetical protein
VIGSPETTPETPSIHLPLAIEHTILSFYLQLNQKKDHETMHVTMMKTQK